MSLLLDYSGKNLTKTEIEATVAAGVIKNFDPNTLQYYCVVCSRNGCGDILPHLLSKEHRNSLIWEAVRQSPPSPAVLQLVPEVVRNAKLRNEVGAVDKNHFSYRCQICVVKKPFNGVAPLEAHLNGKEHEKSKRNMQFTSMPHQTPFLPEENSVPNSKIQKQSPPPPPSPHSSLSSTQPGQVQITKQPISLPFEMGPGLGLGYNRPNRQYLHEADNIHQGTTSVEASQYPHWSYPTHHLASQFSRMSLQDPAPNRSLNTMFGNMQPLSPEAEDAVRNGIVSEGEMSRTGPAYYCNSCRVPLTGARPLVQHVEGEKHKKNVLAASYRREPHNKLFPNVRFPDLKTADSRSLQALPSSTNPEGPQDLRGMNSESPSTNNEIDGEMPFPWIVKVGSHPVSPNDNIYKNLSFPRGVVCIFNYHFSGQHTREGAKKDSFNLKTLFTKMGYCVRLYEDYTKEKTLNKLRNFESDETLKNIDSFILVVLSHGDQDVEFYANSVESDQKMSMDEVRYYFVDGNCPFLKNKPKIFLVNFCRGKLKELPPESLMHDYVEGHEEEAREAPRDMLTIYASIKNFKAIRDREKGTIFVQSLCEVLAEHSHDTPLCTLYKKLCETMQKNAGTIPECQSYYFKTFYFNPLNVDSLHNVR
nr:uncharacterized protein LOC128702607 isoform X1 [Cherax quadricarinatus]